MPCDVQLTMQASRFRLLILSSTPAVDDRSVGAAASVNALPGIMEEDLRPVEHEI